MAFRHRHSLRFFTGLLFGATLSTGWGGAGCAGQSDERALALHQESLLHQELSPLRQAVQLPREGRVESGALVASEFCSGVERESRRAGLQMPSRLDADTVALEASASGCDVVLRYGLSTLDSSEVTKAGMLAMSLQVGAQLCSERPARRVLEHGGSFTSVYEDRAGQPIGEFRIQLADCLAPVARLTGG